jgi:hypothetical protein
MDTVYKRGWSGTDQEKGEAMTCDELRSQSELGKRKEQCLEAIPYLSVKISKTEHLTFAGIKFRLQKLLANSLHASKL